MYFHLSEWLNITKRCVSFENKCNFYLFTLLFDKILDFYAYTLIKEQQ